MLRLDCLLFVGPVSISIISCIVSQMSNVGTNQTYTCILLYVIVTKTLVCTQNLVKISIKIEESPSREVECSKSLQHFIQSLCIAL